MEFSPVHDRILRRQYYDISSPGAFSSAQSLKKQVSQVDGFHIPLEKVRRWLSNQITYTIFRKRKVKIQRRPIQSYYKFQNAELDLLQLGREESLQNENFTFILIIVEGLTRYAYTKPLLNKRSETVASAFSEIINKNNTVFSSVYLDHGPEFRGKFVEFCKSMNIKVVYSNDSTKASRSERLLRTFRQKISRFQHYTGSLKFIDQLENITESYNKSVHRVIGTTPYKALHEIPSQVLFEKQYGKKQLKFDILSQLRENDLPIHSEVRISTLKGKLSKNTAIPNWSSEIFKIHKIIPRYNNLTYILKDSNQQLISGSFIRDELLPINLDTQSIR
jgi:hypothetical protein